MFISIALSLVKSLSLFFDPSTISSTNFILYDVVLVKGSWFEHNLFWWQRRYDPNVLFLKYEDAIHVSILFKTFNAIINNHLSAYP